MCNDFRDDNYDYCHETRDVQDEKKPTTSIVGRRIRVRCEALEFAQEKVEKAIGLDKSNSGRVQHLLVSDLDHP